MNEDDENNDLEMNTSIDPNMQNSALEKINVNAWFNRIESRLQYCLVKEDSDVGFMQYKMLVAHAELIALSSQKVKPKEYKKAVEILMKDIDEDSRKEVRELKEAMIKYKVILTSLLENKIAEVVLGYNSK